MIFDITKYGAIPDGKTVCTQAIQKAIDDCTKTGGQVLVPSGKFVSGSLQIRSNVEIHLELGAYLICSTDPADQINFLKDMQDDNLDTGWDGGCFLFALHERNVAITGEGIIDGQGRFYYKENDADGGLGECPLTVTSARPRMSYLEDVQNLTVQGVTFKDAAFWTLHLAGCRNVMIEGIRIENNERCPNNDGIDPDCCQNVLINNCNIQCADDCVVIKTTGPMTKKYGESQNIVVSNCILSSHSAALKLGTETWGDINHIIISNCILNDCNRAFGIFSRDGGNISDVLVHHIMGNTRIYADCLDKSSQHSYWWGKGDPFLISATKRPGVERIPGKIEGISMDHIYLNCEGTAAIAGEPYSVIRGISIKDSRINFKRQSSHIPNSIDENPSARGCYPHEPNCLYIRRAENIDIPETIFYIDKSMKTIIKNNICYD